MVISSNTFPQMDISKIYLLLKWTNPERHFPKTSCQKDISRISFYNFFQFFIFYNYFFIFHNFFPFLQFFSFFHSFLFFTIFFFIFHSFFFHFSLFTTLLLGRSHWRAFLGCFFDIGSAISRCGTTIQHHYSKRKWGKGGRNEQKAETRQQKKIFKTTLSAVLSHLRIFYQ